MSQHYAVKTIENVVSQGGEWAARFASEAVAADLLRQFFCPLLRRHRAALLSDNKPSNDLTAAGLVIPLIRRSVSMVALTPGLCSLN